MLLGYRFFPYLQDDVAFFLLLWLPALLITLPGLALAALAATSRRPGLVHAVAWGWAGLTTLLLLSDAASVAYTGNHLPTYTSYLADMVANPELAGFDMVGGTSGLIKPLGLVVIGVFASLTASSIVAGQAARRLVAGRLLAGLMVSSLGALVASQFLWSDMVVLTQAQQRLAFSPPGLLAGLASRWSQGVRIVQVDVSAHSEDRVVLHNYGPDQSLRGWKLATRLHSYPLSGELPSGEELTFPVETDPTTDRISLLDAQGQARDALQYTPASQTTAASLPYPRNSSAALAPATARLQEALRHSMESAPPIDRQARTSSKKDVVIVMAEAWRRDSVTPTGAPNVVALGQRGTVLANHFSGSNATHSALYTLLYGRCPIFYRRDLEAGLLPQLTESLHASGYGCNYFCSTSSIGWKRMELMINSRAFDGIFLGTKKISNSGRGWPEKDREFFQAIPKLLKDKSEPQLVLIHPMSTHFPYPYPAEFDLNRPSADIDSDLLKATPHVLKNRYANSVRYIDALIGELARNLDMENTILIITGDHGESIWDDGTIAHAALPSEVELAVPFVMVGGGAPVARVERITYHGDVVATLLNALEGRPVAIAGGQGESALAAESGRGCVPVVSYVTGSPYPLIFMGADARLMFMVASEQWYSGRADVGILDPGLSVTLKGSVSPGGVTSGGLPAGLDAQRWNGYLQAWADSFSKS